MALFWKKKSNTSGAGSDSPGREKSFRRKVNPGPEIAFVHPKVYSVKNEEPSGVSFSFKDLILPIQIITIIFSLWFLFLSPFFRVKYIFVQNDVSQSVSESLKGLKGRNIFLLRLANFTSQLEKQEPQVKQITLTRGIPDTLRLKIEERGHVLAWSSQNEVYLLDKEGIIFSKPENANSVDLLPVVDRRAMKVSLGQRIVSPYFVEFVQKLLEEIPFRTGQKVRGLAIDETSFTLEVTLENGIKAIFDLNASLDNQASALAQALTEHGGEIKDYVDVRVESKVFFK